MWLINVCPKAYKDKAWKSLPPSNGLLFLLSPMDVVLNKYVLMDETKIVLSPSS